MRTGSVVSALVALTVACGGSAPTTLSHATLDQDYSGAFTGSWEGLATTVVPNRGSQTVPVRQPIDRTDFNRLSIVEVCPGAAGKAGIDTATSFSMDPMTCSPVSESCGPVTIRYDTGTGTVSQDTLTLKLTGTASGCGQTLSFTLTFTGTRTQGAADGGTPDGGTGGVDHGPPSAALGARAVDATLGVAVTLDASASADPDGRPLTFAWWVAGAPRGAEPVLSGADTATPRFTANTQGAYLVGVRVTASDGETAVAGVSLYAHAPIPDGRTFIELIYEPRDPSLGGPAYLYTQADATISVTANGPRFFVNVAGSETWQSAFVMPSAFSQLQPGVYAGVPRYGSADPARGGFEWGSNGFCTTVDATVSIASVAYTGGNLSALEFTFEQRCDGNPEALHGHVRWFANDPTAPPGPVWPPPPLWAAPAGAVPPSGNYVYLDSDPGDFIGMGTRVTYTPLDAVIGVTGAGNHVSVSVQGDEWAFGDFQGMSFISELQPGEYGNLARYPFNNPLLGGLDWSGSGRGCNQLGGWFVVDDVAYANGALTSIDLRFEQHCDFAVAALHGQIHWDASDTTRPPGPVVPPPSDLWQPAAGATPAAGSYVYLQSDRGEPIVGGGAVTLTADVNPIQVTAAGNHVHVSVTSPAYWNGDFQAMYDVTPLQPGYYGNLERYPFHNPARGGLDWSGNARGCNTLTGWFVVDDLAWSGDVLTAIDLRFEQHCDGVAPALHGKVHWTTN